MCTITCTCGLELPVLLLIVKDTKHSVNEGGLFFFLPLCRTFSALWAGPHVVLKHFRSSLQTCRFSGRTLSSPDLPPCLCSAALIKPPSLHTFSRWLMHRIGAAFSPPVFGSFFIFLSLSVDIRNAFDDPQCMCVCVREIKVVNASQSQGGFKYLHVISTCYISA